MSGLIEPSQRRSARTLESVLEAAETLLSRTTPDSVSIAEICRVAGVTTGAFYARFRDREALFRVLEDRVYEDFRETMGRALESTPLEDGLEGIVTSLVDGTVELYRRRRGAIRAIRSLALTDGERRRRVAEHNGALMVRIVSRLLDHRSEIRRPDPESAARDVLVWVVAILRQQILYDELAMGPPTPAPTRGMVELTMAYLTSRGRRDDDD